MTESDEAIQAEVNQRLLRFLGLRMYMSRSRPRTADLPPMSVILAHLKFIEDLERRGVLFITGPFFAEDAEAFDGTPQLVDTLAVVRADSLAEAEAIIKADPLHSGGYRGFELEPWTLDAGALNVSAWGDA
jgi:uncharacterized protein